MRSKSRSLPHGVMLWSANRSSCIDITSLYIGKPEPYTHKDVYYPFVGQPLLMTHLLPALESYAASVGGNTLAICRSFLNAFFTFLTEKHPDGRASIANIHSALIYEHALSLRNTPVPRSMRVRFHTTGNRILHNLSLRYAEEVPHLSQFGKPLRYPSIKQSSIPRSSRVTQTDLAPHLEGYCLQVLGAIDSNPFRDVDPQPGTDVTNPAHVLHHYLQHWKMRISGCVSCSWSALQADDYPWKSTPFVTSNSVASASLGLRIGELWCGGKIVQMREALFPTGEEVIASVLLVTLETAWVDTAKAFSFEGNWYTTIAIDPNRPSTKDYVALTPQTRPKTGKEIWTNASHTARGGSWWTLKRIERRRKHLKTLLDGRADELNRKLNVEDPSDTRWDDLRRERDRWRVMSDLAFIFLGSTGISSAVTLSSSLFSKFLARIPDRANLPIPKDLHGAFRKMSHYDVRHLAAERTFRESVFYGAKELLGHSRDQTTLTYLRSRQLKGELFAIYANVAGIAFDEIEQKAILNRAVIRERYVRDGSQLTPSERRALGGMTLHGARCRNAASPPPEAGSQSQSRCVDGSCIRCPLAVWNWHDEFAIPMAVNEYVRLSAEVTPGYCMTDDADLAAWEALFSEIPRSLGPRLNAELERAGVKLGEIYE